MWNHISTGFSGEETANFGQRQEYEGYSALYEVQTLATISPSDPENVKDNPKVVCVASSKYIAVAVNQHLSIFSEQCQELLFTLNFESNLECLTWDDSSLMLFIGENNGDLHIVYTPIMKIILSMPLLSPQSQDDVNFQTISLVRDYDKGNSKILILDSSNTLHLFENLSISLLHEAFQCENLNTINQIKSLLKQSQFGLSTAKISASSSWSSCGAFYEFVAGGNGVNNICLWRDVKAVDSFQGMSFPDMNVKKVLTTCDGKYMFALDHKGTLAVICLRVHNILKIFNDIRVLDLILLETTNDSGLICCSIATIIVDSNGLKSFQLRSFPDFNLLYSLVLTSFAVLVPFSNCNDELYLVEGVISNEDSSIIDTLRVRTISESLPECRLMQLLHRRKFTEAEHFAKLFKLDSQIVYKSRVAYILEMLSPWRIHSVPTEQITELRANLISSLNSIQDAEYVVESCLKVCLPTISDTKQMIDYGQTILQKKTENLIDNDENAEILIRLVAKINSNLQRLETFDQAFGNSQFSELWSTFSTCCLKTEMMNRLRRSEVYVALTIWERHKGEFISNDENIIVELLSELPDVSFDDNITLWLKESMIPSVISMCPKLLDLVANWMINLAKRMELVDKNNWPMNAISFLKVFTDVCSHFTGGSGDGNNLNFTSQLVLVEVQKRAVCPNSAISMLIKIISDLDQLLELKSKYNCRLSLMEFCLEDKVTVMFSIFDALPKVEDVPNIIKSFMDSFAKKAHLTLDSVLQAYISNTMKQSTYNWWHWEEAPWQESVLSIVRCVQNLDVKIQCILEVAKLASIPWSKDIASMVDETLKLNHPSISDLKEQHRLVGFKSVLVKYGLHQYLVTNKQNSERLMRYILSQDSKTAIEDAIELIKSYKHLSLVDIYNFRMRFFVGKGDIESFLALLADVPADIRLQCCKHLFHFTVGMLSEKCLLGKKAVQLEAMKFTQATLMVLRAVEMEPECAEVCQSLDDLKLIYSLQKEFNVFISLEDFSDSSYMQSVFNDLIDTFMVKKPIQLLNLSDNGCHNEKPKVLSQSHIFRIADLIKMSREEAMSKLILKYADIGDVDMLMSSCSELCNEVLTSMKNAITVVETIAKLFDTYSNILSLNPKISSVIAQIASAAVTFSKSDEIMKTLEQSRWTSIALLLHEQSDRWEHPLHQQSLAKDPYADWTFSSLHKDVALRVKSADVIPMVFQTAKMSSNYDDTSTKLVEVTSNLRSKCKQVTQYLAGKSQDSIAFIILMSTINSALNLINCDVASVNSAENKKKAFDEIDGMLHDRNLLELSLLKKIFNAKDPDCNLAIGLLLCMPTRNILSALKLTSTQMGSNYACQNNLAVMGSHLSTILELPTKIYSQFVGLEKRAKWGEKLSRLQIPFKEAFANGLTLNISKVLSDICANPNVEMDFVKDYCVEFDLDINDALLKYLNATLLSVSADTNKSMLMNCLRKSEEVLENNLNTNALIDLYQVVLTKIDSYSYEILMFIHRSIHKNVSKTPELIKSSEKALKLLDALMLYKRIKPPGNEEVDHWSKTPSSAFDLPKLSSQRLPFHILNSSEPWKIITPELDLKTLDMWLAIASILKVSSNQLRVMTVQNVVPDWIKQNSGDGFENSLNCDGNFLENIRKVISEINNEEMATACANWLVQRFPKGAYKVKAAKIALSFSEEWVKAAGDQKSSYANDKLCSTYQRLATEQILHTYSLATPDNIAISAKSVKLIFRLFENISVGQFISSCHEDVFRAAQEISDINNCNFDKICMNILEKWLPAPENLPEATHDQTMDFNLVLTAIKDSSNENSNVEQEEDIRRAIYLLQQQRNQVFKMAYLVQIGLSESLNVSSTQKYQALRCLLSITNEEEVKSLTKLSFSELRHKMECLLCVSQLESLHLPYTLDEFQRTNKVELVESVLHSHANEPMALEFVCSLCFHYKLYLPPLWEVILKQMVTLGMMAQLDNILSHIMNVPELCHCNAFLDSLNLKLKNNFSEVLPPLDGRQTRECYKSLLLLLKCSVLNGLEIAYVANLFAKNEMWSAAIACYLRIQDNQLKDQSIKRIIEDISGPKILSEMHHLKAEYSCNIIYLLPVKQYIFKYISENELYDGLLSSPYLMEIIGFMMDNNTIAKFVTFLSAHERYNDAINIINLYKKKQNDDIKITDDENSQLEIIQEFIESKVFHALLTLDLTRTMLELIRRLPGTTRINVD